MHLAFFTIYYKYTQSYHNHHHYIVKICSCLCYVVWYVLKFDVDKWCNPVLCSYIVEYIILNNLNRIECLYVFKNKCNNNNNNNNNVSSEFHLIDQRLSPFSRIFHTYIFIYIWLFVQNINIKKNIVSQ